MADWDENSPQLKNNLTILLERVRRDARSRKNLDLKLIRAWHRRMMLNLDAPSPQFVGRFRGEKGAELIQVHIGAHKGTPPFDVHDELDDFEKTLIDLIKRLDTAIPTGHLPNDREIQAIVSACGWAHAEWVRIHPFVNGNGRTARILANSIAMRYGLPPFVRLRPRPDGADYASVSMEAMQGSYQPTIEFFIRLLNDYLSK